MRISKFVALVALAAAASSCSSPQTTSNVQTADQSLTAPKPEETPAPRPTKLREALVGSNTAIVIRVRSGNWPELASFVGRLDEFDPQNEVSRTVRRVFEDGIIAGLGIEDMPGQPHIRRVLSDVDQNRDIWLRLDSTVSDEEAALLRDGLFLPRPPIEMEDFATFTLFVPAEDPTATRNEALAVKTGDHATIETLDGHVVIRQGFPALSVPEPLVKEDVVQTAALEAFFASDGIGAAYVRPEQAMWIAMDVDEATDARDVAARMTDRPTFAQETSVAAARRGQTMPPHAIEARDWVAVLRGGEDGAMEVTGFGEYTTSGAKGADAAMSPKTARVPGIVLPKWTEGKLFVESEGAVAPAKFNEWVESLNVPKTAFNEPRFYDRNIDEPVENPQFWAAPLQTALNGLAPLGLNETRTASWAIYGWRSPEGRQESVFAIYLSDVLPDELRQRSRELRHVQLRQIEGGTLLLAPRASEFPAGVQVLPWSEWRAVPTGSFFIEGDLAKESRRGSSNPAIAFGAVRAEVALTDTAFQFRGLLGATEDTSAFALVPVAPTEMNRQESPCIAPLRESLFSVGDALDLDERSTRNGEAKRTLAETLPAFEKALAECRKTEPDQAAKWDLVEGRMAWAEVMYKLVSTGVPGAGDVPKACKAGVPGTCGDAIGAWSGKTCAPPEFAEVLIAADTVREGDQISFDDTGVVCMPSSVAEKSLKKADWEKLLPAKASRRFERGETIRAADLESTTDR